MAVRQLKIKTGSVVRLSKELGMYAEEQRVESSRVAGMRADNADSHDIQHAVSCYRHSICDPPPSLYTLPSTTPNRVRSERHGQIGASYRRTFWRKQR